MVEFPAGVGQLALAVVDFPRPGGRARFQGLLEPGATIVFRTVDPILLPLPHPLLFQLHAICSRILAMKAAAGWQPDIYDEDDDAVSSLCPDYVPGEEHYEPEYLVNEPYWPPVPMSITPTPSSEWHDLAVSKVNWSREEQGLDWGSKWDREAEMQRVLKESSDDDERPRWPSVVSREYHARMEEMWQKCGERLGRKVRGGHWWV